MRPTSVLTVAGIVWFGISGAARAADAPSFTKDIQPLLNRYCVQCHAQTKPKAGVRLDSYEGIMNGRRRAVVAGDPDQSRLILTMTGKGRLMPPKKTNPRPTAEEIETIKTWIKNGAKKDDAKAAAAAMLRERATAPIDQPAAQARADSLSLLGTPFLLKLARHYDD